MAVSLLTTKCPSHIETSQLICSANQLTGFYIRTLLVVKGLRKQQELVFRSSCPEASWIKALLECLQACNFIKKRLQHRCFPVNIAKFSKNIFWKTYVKIFLNVWYCWKGTIFGYFKILRNTLLLLNRLMKFSNETKINRCIKELGFPAIKTQKS